MTAFSLSCSKDEPCGKGYKYEGGACFKLTATKPDSDTSAPKKDPETDQDADGDDSGNVTTTGLGDSCTEQKQCADKDANYCMVNPLDGKGFCTIKGCSNTAGSCPADYICCVLPDSYGGPVCLDPTSYQSAKSMGACGT